MTDETAEAAIEAEIVSILRQTMTSLADVEITAEMTFEELGLDSLTRIDVLAAAEGAFDLEVPDAAVAEMIRVQDLVDLVSAVRVG